MGKKIVVLGGVGKMCSSTVIDLSKDSTFSEIVLADGDMKRAKSLAESLKDSRITCQSFDAKDMDSISAVIKGSDIVVEGLPGLFSANAMKAAIKAKIRFIVSINPPTLDGKLDREAWQKSDKAYKQAGIGVTMSGGQPIIESLALMAADRMDRVDEVHIAWEMSRPFSYGSPGLVDTLLHEEDPKVNWRTYYADGKLVEGVEPFAMIKTWDFPESIKRECGGEVYAQTHADPYFLLAVFPKAKIITSRGTWRKETNEFLRFLNKYGLYGAEPIEVDGVKVSPIKFIRNMWVHICKVEEAKIVSGEKKVEDWGECVLEAEVIGVKDGLGVRGLYTFAPPPHPWHEWFRKDPIADYGVYVGIPASIVAIMIAKGDIAVDTGLFRASEIEPAKGKFPEKFLNELKKRGFSVYRRA
jgi:saccharopine dehydrogenase-like NADP-dependent oxidoreductase